MDMDSLIDDLTDVPLDELQDEVNTPAGLSFNSSV